jgi:hypothetical protein
MFRTVFFWLWLLPVETDDNGTKAWTRPESIGQRLSSERNKENLFIVK